MYTYAFLSYNKRQTLIPLHVIPDEWTGPEACSTDLWSATEINIVNHKYSEIRVNLQILHIYTIIQNVSGKPQMSDWYPPPQQQYPNPTSGGRHKATHAQTTAAVSVCVCG